MFDRTHKEPLQEDDEGDQLMERLETICDRLTSLEEVIRSMNEAEPHTHRKFYSVDEFSKLVGRAKYTVREWCRHGRIEAEKCESGRGPEKAWKIPATELQRVLDDGLFRKP